MKQLIVPAALLACLGVLPLSAQAQEFEDVHKCDEYAAHPNDPHRWAAGVADADIIPGPAVKFCTQAVQAHDATPRFAFQLGRAQWAANRMEDGLQTFLALEERFSYPPVYAYLGEAFYLGLGGAEQDEALALSLFELAAADNFEPAVLALEQLSGEAPATVASAPVTAPAPQPKAAQAQPQQQPQQQVAQTQPQAPPAVPFDPAKFSQPGIIKALASGNFDSMSVTGFGKTNYAGLDNTIIYINNFHAEFGGTYNMKDPYCVGLYDPQVDRRLKSRATRALMGGSRDDMAARGFNMMGQLLTDMTSNGGLNRMVEMEQAAQALASSGAQDGGKLILFHGCQSEIVQTIYANLKAYAYGRAPKLSAEEKARVAEANARKREREKVAAARKLRTDAQQSCVNQFKKSAFCGCIIKNLETHKLADSEWKSLGQSFREILVVAKEHDGFADQLKNCRQKG